MNNAPEAGMNVACQRAEGRKVRVSGAQEMEGDKRWDYSTRARSWEALRYAQNLDFFFFFEMPWEANRRFKTEKVT